MNNYNWIVLTVQISSVQCKYLYEEIRISFWTANIESFFGILILYVCNVLYDEKQTLVESLLRLSESVVSLNAAAVLWVLLLIVLLFKVLLLHAVALDVVSVCAVAVGRCCCGWYCQGYRWCGWCCCGCCYTRCCWCKPKSGSNIIEARIFNWESHFFTRQNMPPKEDTHILIEA